MTATIATDTERRARRRAPAVPDLALLATAPSLHFLEGDYFFRDAGEKRSAGKFLSPASVRAAFCNERFDTGWIPEHVVRCGSTGKGDFAVLFSPPRRYTISILIDEKTVPATVPLPALVLAGAGGKYRIWAIKGTTFSPDARLYWVPLPNVYNRNTEPCGVCWGSVRPPAVKASNMAKALRLFLDSVFTPNETRHNRSRRHPDDIRTMLLELSASEADVYPEDDLIPLDPSEPLARAVEEFVGGVS